MAHFQTIGAGVGILRPSKKSQNGLRFEMTVKDSMERQFPNIVHVADPFTGIWNKTPIRNGPPLIGNRVSVEHERVYDILFADPHAFPKGLLIECKYQEVAGTAYNKISYDLLRGHETATKFDGCTVAIVCGGVMFERGAGAKVVRENVHWRKQLGLQCEIFPSHREFLNWWSFKIRAHYSAANPNH